MRRTGAPWRLLRVACTRAVRAARVSASVRTTGCRQSPSASAGIRWRALFDNTPVVIGLAAGSACLVGPFARPLADPLRKRGGSGEMAVRGVALPPFLVAGGSLRSGKCGPRLGDVGGGCWGRICVRHRGLLRVASTPWVSVVRSGQVDAVLAGVSGRHVVPEHVARPRVAGLYEGSCWAKSAQSGSLWFVADPAAAGVTVIVRSSGGRRRSRVRRAVSSLRVAGVGLVPCACGRASCRSCRSCGWLRVRTLGGYPHVVQGRCGGH